MMTSTTAVRISWLVGADHEVYRVHRGVPHVADVDWPAPGGRPVPFDGSGCARCGGHVSFGSGARAPLYFFHRKRGTLCAEVRAGVIHRGCIPDRESTANGIPARARHASQVRA